MKPSLLVLAFLAAIAARPAAAQDDLQGLPLKEIPPAAGAADYMAVVISGDGGWIGPAPAVAHRFAEAGAPVVGWNAMSYFLHRRTADELGTDMQRVLRHYLAAWGKSKVVLVGYSRGADVLPFMVSRLPADLRSRVELVGLLGPSHTVDFKLHLSDLFGNSGAKTALPLLPEVARLRGLRLVCVYGSDETDSICPELDRSTATIIERNGGHHLGGDFRGIAGLLLDDLAASSGPHAPG
jgi:type IV secretory pathway VirJ component